MVHSWLDGSFELFVSPRLVGELARALDYPKLRKRVTSAEAEELMELLRHEASCVLIRAAFRRCGLLIPATIT